MTEFLITCEHGGNQVPAEYQALFASGGAARDLNSHRGLDPGALDAANQFAQTLDAPRIASETTRLLVDLNRSLDNTSLYSRYTTPLSDDAKMHLLQDWYTPYRSQVETSLRRQFSAAGRVVHLSIHTFTPRYRGKWRPIDVGLLFDPDRSSESSFCLPWLEKMNQYHPKARVVTNQPYAGTDDGFTTYLRRQFDEANYLGIEIEINHRYWKRSVDSQRSVVKALLNTLP